MKYIILSIWWIYFKWPTPLFSLSNCVRRMLDQSSPFNNKKQKIATNVLNGDSIGWKINRILLINDLANRFSYLNVLNFSNFNLFKIQYALKFSTFYSVDILSSLNSRALCKKRTKGNSTSCFLVTHTRVFWFTQRKNCNILDSKDFELHKCILLKSDKKLSKIHKYESRSLMSIVTYWKEGGSNRRILCFDSSMYIISSFSQLRTKKKEDCLTFTQNAMDSYN